MDCVDLCSLMDGVCVVQLVERLIDGFCEANNWFD